MEFRFETKYDKKAMTVMARALRKTVRKKRSLKTRIFAVIVAVLGLALSIGDVIRRGVGGKTIVTWLAVVGVSLAAIFEDRLNGFAARKSAMAGFGSAKSVFTEDEFITETGGAKTEWSYDRVALAAETPEYFVLIFDKNHAQLCDKATIEGGTALDFRAFLAGKIGRPVVRIAK